MYIVIGLGNPGEQYLHTRHNAGFDVIEILAQMNSVSVKKRAHKSLVAETVVAGEKILLCKSQTYMNLSGEAVSELVNYYKIRLDRLIVVYDDADLPLGEIRIRKEGGSGTHNGMRSVISMLEGEEFTRVRVGIGPVPDNVDISCFVLSEFKPDERATAFDAFMRAAKAVMTIIGEGVESAQAKFNGRVKTGNESPG